MKKLILAFSLLFIAYSGLYSQHQEVCGVVDQTAILERLKENKRSLQGQPQLRNDDLFYVPLQFHIVTDDDGEGAIGEEKILEQLCRLNEDYAPLNMRFYLKNSFNYIAYTRLYEDPGNTFATLKMSSNKVNNAINIFIVDQIGSNSTGTTLGYYQPDKDWIVVIKDRVNAGTQTLSHELGHFFSLAHPFYGWEGCPYIKSELGSPLTITEVPCSGALIELVDGSNCEQSADLICDTPPDYNFGLVDPEGNCSLDFEVKDFNGDVIDVMENNYMSYFFNCADYAFTQTQIDLMRADYQSSGRNYIRSNFEPDTTELTGEAPVITAPSYNATVPFFDWVEVDWNDMPGVSRYLVKVTTGFFTKVTQYYTVKNQSKLLLTDLPADEKNVTVVIWPFNEGNSCNTQASQTHKFKTSSIPINVQDLTANGDFKLYPSPGSIHDAYLNLWSAAQHPDTRIELINFEGKLIFSQQKNVQLGNNIIEFRKKNLYPGFYVLKLITQNNYYSKKIILAE